MPSSGCEKYRKFLLGSPFIVRNDHNPLKKLFGSNSPIPENCSARIQRWALRLSQFQFNVEYIKGSDNINSDFLSRLPLKETAEINEPFELIFSIKSLENMPITCHDIMLHTDRDQNLSKLNFQTI